MIIFLQGVLACVSASYSQPAKNQVRTRKGKNLTWRKSWYFPFLSFGTVSSSVLHLWSLICLPFTPHLRISPDSPAEQRLAHSQLLEKVLDHLSPFVGIGLLLFGRAEIEVTILNSVTFCPIFLFRTQPGYLGLPKSSKLNIRPYRTPTSTLKHSPYLTSKQSDYRNTPPPPQLSLSVIFYRHKQQILYFFYVFCWQTKEKQGRQK